MTISFVPTLRAPLRCAAGVALALLCACAPMAHTPAPVVSGTQWTVVELDGDAIAPGVTATLAIAKDGGVSGSDGCNRFVGGLVFEEGGKVAASPTAGVSTRMACPGARDGVARRYNALRREAATWRLEGGTLVLSTADGRTVTLRRSD